MSKSTIMKGKKGAKGWNYRKMREKINMKKFHCLLIYFATLFIIIFAIIECVLKVRIE